MRAFVNYGLDTLILALAKMAWRKMHRACRIAEVNVSGEKAGARLALQGESFIHTLAQSAKALAQLRKTRGLRVIVNIDVKNVAHFPPEIILHRPAKPLDHYVKPFLRVD